MSRIKVGDYIRTSSGTIGKVGRIEGSFLCDKNDMLIGVVEGVVKNSPNIIDLIEEGDYVNSRKVKRKFLDIFTKKKRLEIEGTEINWQGDMSTIYCEIEDIKSIVTKEQFEQMKYVVEE